jgi:uncharacterized membrane protein
MNPAVASRRRSRAANALKESKGGQGTQADGRVNINVGEAERQLSMISGTILAMCGLLRGSVSGLGFVVLGGALIYRGHTGHCSFYEALGQTPRTAMR